MNLKDKRHRFSAPLRPTLFLTGFLALSGIADGKPLQVAKETRLAERFLEPEEWSTDELPQSFTVAEIGMLWRTPSSGPTTPRFELSANSQDQLDSPIISERLRLGLRLVYRSLLDRKRTLANTFLGSINELDLMQTSFPAGLFAQWLFNDYLAAEIAWEHLRVKTVTAFDKHTDGTFDLAGPMLTLIGRYPNRSRFTPAGGIGLFFINAEFENDPIWHNGFDFDRVEEYYAWLEAGSPSWPNGGKQRTIDAKDARGTVFAAGCEIRIAKRFWGEVSLRFVQAAVDGHYYISRYGKIIDNRGITSFPMSHLSCGIGLMYSF
ncbi:MAG: hypothetical protein ACUVWX_03280 [Kiritimatiellia bacterium]